MCPHWPELANEMPHATPRRSRSPARSSGKSKASTPSTQTQHQPPPRSHIFSSPGSLSSNRMPRLSEPGPLVCAPSTGTTSAPGWARQLVLSCHCFHRHCLHARRGLSIPARWSGHAPSQTRTRTLTTPHDVAHRLALKAVIAHTKPSVMAAAGPLQHGVVCRMEPTRC